MSNEKKTHWKKLTNPNYLGTYALNPNEDLIATIDHVRQEDVTSPDGSEDTCTVVYFKEDIKPFILNVTNAKQIERIYSTPYIEDWAGKMIQIYIADNIKAFGDTVTGLRIRPKVPTKRKQELTPSHHKWGDAVSALAKGKTSLKKIRKHYLLDEEMEDILLDDVKDCEASKNGKS
ncbi:MAG TPA: hypothetical protein VLA13_04010 [Massilibacterium sp.]|nr:hypothetical protein [Massilibacterium sp.]